MDINLVLISLYKFTAESDDELGFGRNELFYLLKDHDSEWYRVQSLANYKEVGLVPKSFVAPLKKIDCYCQASFDFNAEGSDELSVREGDDLILLAVSQGWYLARRVFKPQEMGLVPMNYVQLVYTPKLPSIQEWKLIQKKETTASIISSASSFLTDSSATSKLSIIQASIPTFKKGFNNRFSFTVHVERTGNVSHILHRSYDDFYKLQKKLIQHFPKEAGKVSNVPRTLPYLPAPVDIVTEAITQKRREDIDRYLKDLLKMPDTIRESKYLLDFLRPWKGDRDVDGLEKIEEVTPDEEMNEKQKKFTSMMSEQKNSEFYKSNKSKSLNSKSNAYLLTSNKTLIEERPELTNQHFASSPNLLSPPTQHFLDFGSQKLPKTLKKRRNSNSVETLKLKIIKKKQSEPFIVNIQRPIGLDNLKKKIRQIINAQISSDKQPVYFENNFEGNRKIELNSEQSLYSAILSLKQAGFLTIYI